MSFQKLVGFGLGVPLVGYYSVVGWEIYGEKRKTSELEDIVATLVKQQKVAESGIKETETLLIGLEESLRQDEKTLSRVSADLESAVERVRKLEKEKLELVQKTTDVSGRIAEKTGVLQKLVADVASYREQTQMAEEAMESQRIVLKESKRLLSPMNHPYFQRHR